MPAARVRRLILALAGILILGILIDGLVVEPNRLVPREITIPCPGLRAGSIRILLFADVDFLGPGRRERAIRREALLFKPDLVLVAGDLLNRPWATQDASVLQAADEYLGSLPAPSGRFLAPGEEESPVAASLRDAWSGGSIQVLSNESRRIDVRGERLELFVADPGAEPGPWSAGRDGERSYVAARGRQKDQALVYRGEKDGAIPDWKDVEITFMFQALDDNSSLDFRFAWREIPGPPWGGDGFRLLGNQYHADFRLHSHLRVPHRLIGRRYSGFVPPVGVWCRSRIRLSEDGARTLVRARFWRETDPEPAEWQIDAGDTRPSRDWSGTVAFAAHSGRTRYADLRVLDGEGRVLLEEPFRNPERLRTVWRYRSALADWLFEKNNSASARVLLAHNPDLVLDLADLVAPAPDIVLAGHTHGGQVRLLGIGALFTSTKIGRHYDMGLFDFRGIPLYITAGVGTSTLPVRLFDPPEVTLLTLVPRSQASPSER